LSSDILINLDKNKNILQEIENEIAKFDNLLIKSLKNDNN